MTEANAIILFNHLAKELEFTVTGKGKTQKTVGVNKKYHFREYFYGEDNEQGMVKILLSYEDLLHKLGVIDKKYSICSTPDPVYRRIFKE